MRKIKIAQIGTSGNSHGSDIFKTLKLLPDVFEIVGYAMPENEKEKFPPRMGIFEGYKELTVEQILNNPEIEAVTVETEEIYLTKYATLVAEHNKHMHMEKPGSSNLPEFENLINIVSNNNKVFHTGYMYRYNPYIKELINQIKSGELGEIISIEAQMNCYHPKEVRDWLKAFPGGIMYFLGCHLVDIILQIQGTPKNIIPLNKYSGVDNVSGKDFGMVVFEYENGVSFAKVSSVERGGFMRRQLVVSGTKGTVEIRPLEYFEKYPGQFSDKREVFDADWCADSEFVKSVEFDRYRDMMLSFAAMVRGEKQNPWNCSYELELYKTVLKCCK